MALRWNSFEGGSDTTTITAGNSGGLSGNAFNTVTNTTMTALEYSSAQSAHGALSAHLNGPNPSLGRLEWTGLNTPQIAGYLYFRFNGSLPGVATDILNVRSASAGVFSVGLSSGNLVQVKDSTPATINSPGWTVPSFSGTQWYRLNWAVIPATTTTGTITAELYALDSRTALSTCTVSSTTANAGILNVDVVRVGKVTSAVVFELYVDDLAVNTGSTTPPPMPEDIARPSLVMAPRGVYGY